MKLALEHIQQTLASTERALIEARNGVKATQRQLDEQLAAVARHEKLMAELRSAFDVLRAPAPAETPSAPVIEQLKKTELADRPRATLARKGS